MVRSDRAGSQCEGATVRQFRIDNKGADALPQPLRRPARQGLRRRIREVLAEV